jgi:hypothetical protein
MATHIAASFQATPLTSLKRAEKGHRSSDAPILIVLVILGLASAGALGVGFASFGSCQGWWQVGALSSISQIEAILMMSEGAVGCALFFFVLSSVCLSEKGRQGSKVLKSGNQIQPNSPEVITPPPRRATKPIVLATSSDPTVIDKFSNRLGAEAWEVFGDVGEEPPLPSHLEAMFDPELHHLLLIPATVSGVILNVGFLQYMDNTIGIHYNIFSENGSIRMEASYWVILTKQQLPESCNKLKEEQQELLKENGYAFPTFLEAAILNIFANKLELMSPGYTRCQEGDIVVGVSQYIDLCFRYGKNEVLGAIGARR